MRLTTPKANRSEAIVELIEMGPSCRQGVSHPLNLVYNEDTCSWQGGRGNCHRARNQVEQLSHLARYCITASNNTWGPIVGESIAWERKTLISGNNSSQTLRAVRERILSGLRVGKQSPSTSEPGSPRALYLWVTNGSLGAMRRKAVTTAK